MDNVTRTVNGANLQTHQLLGLPLTILPNTTLNEKLGISTDIALAPDDKVAMRYVVIGNNGHRMLTDAGGVPYPVPLKHAPTDNSLYNQLPFVLRLPSNDLTAAQRANYRLRRIEQHDGVTYVAYYMRLIDLSNTVPQLELRTVDNGVTTSTPYVATLSDLNPTPPAIAPGSVLTTSGDYIAATAKIVFNFTAFDVQEYLNVCNVIYGNDNMAIISDIALCSGADRSVVGDFNGTSLGYVEAIGAQVCNFISTFYPVKYNTSGVDLTFDVGSVEALLTLR